MQLYWLAKIVEFQLNHCGIGGVQTKNRLQRGVFTQCVSLFHSNFWKFVKRS